MNTIATFENTVSILVKAYLNDTLIQCDCAACAVGNIVAARMNLQYAQRNAWLDEGGRRVPADWVEVVMSDNADPEYMVRALAQIQTTGYSAAQVVQIEAAFELRGLSWEARRKIEDTILEGLLAVVDVLAGIHGIDLAAAEVAKGLFVKA